jgi:integrase
MPKPRKPLPRIRTDRDVRRAKPGEAKVADTPGLYLTTREDGRQRWWVRFVRPNGGDPTERGIGHLPQVTLDQARAAVHDMRFWLRHKKIDPKEIKKLSEKQRKTWTEVADMWIELNKVRWRGNSSLHDVNLLLHVHAKPFARMGMAHIMTDHIKQALMPLWKKRQYETLKRAAAKWKKVFDFAQTNEFDIPRLNPARWKDHLANLFPIPKLPKKHLAAVPYAEIPALIQKVRQRQLQHGATAAVALEYTFFTLVRSNEVLGTRWEEIDSVERVWTIPESRTKTGQQFRVPLSDPAMQLLHQLQERSLGGDFVFTGYSQGLKPLTHGTMLEILQSIVPGATVHGTVRSGFRTWAREMTKWRREDVEECLAHKVQGKVELAYDRSDVLEIRREIMTAWASYIG